MQTDPKSRYLSTIRDIVMALHRRSGLSMCPFNGEPSADDIQTVASLNQEVTATCATMRQIESESSQAFGVQALLGEDATDVIRCALAVLVAQALTNEVNVRDVSHLAELCAGRDPIGLLVVHEAFCRNGILRPHCAVRFRGASHIGELRTSIREGSLRLLVGLRLPPDTEMEDLERVAAIVGRG